MATNGTIPTKQNMSATLRLAANAMGPGVGDQWYDREMSRLGNEEAPAPASTGAAAPAATTTPLPPPPTTPGVPVDPAGGGSPAMQGLGHAMRSPASGWNDESLSMKTNAGSLGARTPSQAVNTLSEIMRRFGRTY